MEQQITGVLLGESHIHYRMHLGDMAIMEGRRTAAAYNYRSRAKIASQGTPDGHTLYAPALSLFLALRGKAPNRTELEQRLVSLSSSKAPV